MVPHAVRRVLGPTLRSHRGSLGLACRLPVLYVGSVPAAPWPLAFAVDYVLDPSRSGAPGYAARARARARVDAALAGGGLDQQIHASDSEGRHANLRRLLLDMVEEYGRHTGHADLIRESVDGRAGEDPPPGWRP